MNARQGEGFVDNPKNASKRTNNTYLSLQQQHLEPHNCFRQITGKKNIFARYSWKNATFSAVGTHSAGTDIFLTDYFFLFLLNFF